MTGGWHRNTGQAPIWTRAFADEVCPADRIEAADAGAVRVLVRLRNGSEPAVSWPVGGRYPPRWSLTGDQFDIVEWKRA